MLHRVDIDLNGCEAFQHLIDEGLVTNHECKTYREYDKCIDKLGKTVSPGDVIVVDTLNRAVDLFLDWQLIQVRLKPGQTPSDLQEITNPSNLLNLYGQCGNYVIEPLRGIPCQLIMLCHEGEKFFDAKTGRVVKYDRESNTGSLPDLVAPEGLVLGAAARLPAKAMRTAFDMCSDVFRIGRLMHEKIDEIDGKRIKFPAGTRVLNVSDTVAILAKVHVAVEQYRKLRDNLYDPTLPRLYRMLGLKPRVLMFYGPPGVGKSALAVSVQEDEYKKRHTVKIDERKPVNV